MGEREADLLGVDGEEDACSLVDILHDTGIALLAFLCKDLARDQHTLSLQFALLGALVWDGPSHVTLVKIKWQVNEDLRTIVQLNQCSPIESSV